SPDIKVDASGPSAPSVSLSAATGNTYISGSTVYINPQAGKSGSFQATATSTDSDSGIQKHNFPTRTGFSSGAAGDTTSPYTSRTYTRPGAVTAPETQTTAATNNATLTNTNTFTLTPDTTNPTGGALTVNATTATSGGSNSYSNTGNYTISAINDYI